MRGGLRAPGAKPRGARARPASNFFAQFFAFFPVEFRAKERLLAVFSAAYENPTDPYLKKDQRQTAPVAQQSLNKKLHALNMRDGNKECFVLNFKNDYRVESHVPTVCDRIPNNTICTYIAIHVPAPNHVLALSYKLYT